MKRRTLKNGLVWIALCYFGCSSNKDIPCPGYSNFTQELNLKLVAFAPVLGIKDGELAALIDSEAKHTFADFANVEVKALANTQGVDFSPLLVDGTLYLEFCQIEAKLVVATLRLQSSATLSTTKEGYIVALWQKSKLEKCSLNASSSKELQKMVRELISEFKSSLESKEKIQVNYIQP